MSDKDRDRLREARATFDPSDAPGLASGLRGASPEYRAKVFKSGNSLALRLPKELGMKEGAIMILRKEHGRLVVEPEGADERMIDLTGIYGAIPNLARQPFEENERPWSDLGDRRG